MPARMAEENRKILCDSMIENASTSSNQTFFSLDKSEIREEKEEETEEAKKARLEMEGEVKKMLQNLPDYVKRVVTTQTLGNPFFAIKMIIFFR